ncbi:DNA double-strand break repair protein Mre11 [Salarchaeum sp. JOR-1]|uniref:DNA double-strand break repair protein Mre11 n=1 Tax=Salarchaeum sp. JOR-1 TaxID=2599399 RepID=UPI0011989AFA|nr:DNA double-strand break repair protein Mre11 [Salarchaeum sp. JOR-1]QDX41488.1 exonuclease SbcCD subunit D [Salarchaeum sp. JOR-1]
MTRVIHTGDTHLGYRQYHSPVRRQDFADAFRSVVEDAVEDDVDAVVHAGDLYHDRQPGLPDLLDTIDILTPLREHDIPFLAVVGNHESTRQGQWLDLFETLGLATRLDAQGTVVGDTTFYGLDYVPESKRDQLDYEFATPETAHAALVSHGLFTPFPHANWETETVLGEANVEFDALLLGDNHAPDRAEVLDTWVTYCGSTERASASERDPRGYNIVTFDDGAEITRRGVDTRDFVFLDLELKGDEGTAYVRDRVREADVTDAVVIATIEGEGGQVTPADVEAFGEERGALVTRVNDRREVEDEADIDVSFADPDEAVRERVRELGLSQTARDIDEAVRESKLADANVRDAVKDRVQEAISDAPDPGDGAAGVTEEEAADENDGQAAMGEFQ